MKIEDPKLERLAALKRYMIPEPTTGNEWAYDEYRTLLAEVVPTHLPLVQALIAAGLLSVHFPEDGSAYEIVECFDNGGIWLVAEPEPFMTTPDEAEQEKLRAKYEQN